MPGITGGAHIMNPRSLPPRRVGPRSIIRMMITVSQYLGLITRNTSLIPKRVNNRRPLDIAAPRTIV